MNGMVGGLRGWHLGGLAAAGIFAHGLAFLDRMDLHFYGDSAVAYLTALAFVQGAPAGEATRQFYLGLPDSGVTAVALGLFGALPEVAAGATLALWAVSGGVLTGLVARRLGTWAGAGAAVALAVGVPYTFHYAAQPNARYVSTTLFSALLLWLTDRAVAASPGPWMAAVCGVAGLSWYKHRVIAPTLFALGLAWWLARRTEPARRRVSRFWIAACVGAAVAGAFPEIVARLQHTGRMLPETEAPRWDRKTFSTIRDALGAYLDGDPLSRGPEGIHFHSGTAEARPAPEWTDGIAQAMAVAVVVGGAVVAGRWCADGWIAGGALALVPMASCLGVLVSAKAGGHFAEVRRYQWTLAQPLLVLLGAFAGQSLLRRRWWPVVLVGALLGRSWAHQRQMLRLPDELHWARQVTAELGHLGYRYGTAPFGDAFVFTAMSQRHARFHSRDTENDVDGCGEAAALASSAVYIQREGESGDPRPPRRLELHGWRFVRNGEQHVVGEYRWTPYRRAGGRR